MLTTMILVPRQPLLVLKKHSLINNHFHAKKLIIRNERTSSFNYKSTVNLPLNELPGASFDQYMDDKLRVVKAVFPDKGTTKQLNEEEWRIKMPPIQCIFFSVQPIADVRLRFKSNGEDYPPHIPHHISQILELQFIKWELQGLNTFYNVDDPFHFSLDVNGSMYPERRGKHSWLKNQIEMKINFVVSPAMIFVPDHVLQDAVELVFKTIWNNMKQEFHGRLLADYNNFKRCKFKKNSV
ncbi:uncharacterized protein LOC123905703 [Trifolium pratense]|uniref:uncharacterized protein LOC123905703 n=1 Tax=Trifolium pratense TaxID=57577 RepID=UPI001E6917A1|nr:uncharacterized protein LOC123905703 [Trifolium pratense]